MRQAIIFFVRWIYMYNVNDSVLYGKQGVCKIKDIVTENFTGKPVEYYTLEPTFSDNTVIYVPVENEELVAKMHKILSAEEIDRLIDEVKGTDTIWYDDEKERKAKYNEIISKGDRKELLILIHTLYLNKRKRESDGKKMYVSDERIMKEAEKLIYEEFAAVLNIKPGQVVEYIVNKMAE